MAISCKVSRRYGGLLSLAALGAALALTGCDGGPDDARDDEEGEDGDESASASSDIQTFNPLKEGKRLFHQETFGGNGRTCGTCHGQQTGTITPQEAQARYALDPQDPLFLHDGSDDFQGNGATRMLASATVLVRLKLPPNVKLASDASATSVVVRRGVPTTIDMPALDPVIMLDGRVNSLMSQFKGAAKGHGQAPAAPTDAEATLGVAYEKTLFSSAVLGDYADGGAPPELPLGQSAAQQRGRKWFEDAPVPAALDQDSSRTGLCALCHSGPMLNETNGFAPSPTSIFAVPAGTRFQSVLVSEINGANNPVLDFVVTDAAGTTTTFSTPDVGRALISGNYNPVPDGDRNRFKIQSLWNIHKTGPYFHDNSAMTLADVVDHYAQFFAIVTDVGVDGDGPLIMTAQDKADLVAFLKLL